MSTASFSVKWAGKEYVIPDFPLHARIMDLKQAIYERTGVLPERQKLFGMANLAGKTVSESTRLLDLKLSPHVRIMMVGSSEKSIQDASTPPKTLPNVINDLDDYGDDKEIPIENCEEFNCKIENRIKNYKIKWINNSRPGKRLLVLDIDCTIFDHRTPAQSVAELMRPFLHEFLTSAYEDYDIAFWSATNMKWIDAKLWELGVTRHEQYKVAFLLDSTAMITLHTSKYGTVEIKPLALIWRLVPAYRPENTIMIDDIPRNFLMNPQSGLRVRPFRNAHVNQSTDRELLRLRQYLKDIARSVDDFTQLDHRKWESYMPKTVQSSATVYSKPTLPADDPEAPVSDDAKDDQQP
ncbi:ubiquitin-like domain-containing C-terminal domain phosphatase 1 [Rhipicephalus microplus]|uniref:ubiquitin-like domain-containing C-terminal domain phosphatase 1 n=1 Tax=Rhipicephalus microplus TaxID=6941 RepID=UPI0018880C29|nr:ubiquitin-like domain-containing CTD phosphatase 1 [Rhipicephalus microplus]